MAVKMRKAATRSKKKPAGRRTAAKSTARKTTAKRSPAKKTAAKRAVKKAPAAKPIKMLKNKLTKTELLNILSEQADITRKQAGLVVDALAQVIEASVKKGGLGEFTLPGLFKIVIQHKPATKARKGINPFTGEETMFKAKPARRVVKIRPLKKLKDMAA